MTDHEEHAERVGGRMGRAAIVQSAAATYFMGLAQRIAGRPLTIEELALFATREAQGYLTACWVDGTLANVEAIRDRLAPGQDETEIIVVRPHPIAELAICRTHVPHAHFIPLGQLKAAMAGQSTSTDVDHRRHSRN